MPLSMRAIGYVVSRWQNGRAPQRNQCLMYYWNDSTPNKSLYLAPIAFDLYISHKNIFFFFSLYSSCHLAFVLQWRLNDDDRRNTFRIGFREEAKKKERKKSFDIIIKKDVLVIDGCPFSSSFLAAQNGLRKIQQQKKRPTFHLSLQSKISITRLI